MRGHGEGTISERPDGTFAVAVSLPGGKRVWRYRRTKREAKTALRELQRERDQDRLRGGKRATFSQFSHAWLEDVRLTLKPSTYDSYDLNVRRLDPFLGKVPLEKLTRGDIQNCASKLAASGLSASTVRQAHAVAKIILNEALARDEVIRNVALGVHLPRAVSRPIRPLDETQMRRLIDGLPGDRFAALWYLMVITGLRLGEATALTWEDVDTVLGRVHVRRTLHRVKGQGLVFSAPKTKRSRRSVHVIEPVLMALEAHRARQDQERDRVQTGWRDENLVFCTGTGGPLDPGAVNKSFHRTLDVLDLPSIRVHDLRHTAATYFMERGANIGTVQDLLGHSSSTLTLDTYTHSTARSNDLLDGLMTQLHEGLTSSDQRPAAREAGQSDKSHTRMSVE